MDSDPDDAWLNPIVNGDDPEAFAWLNWLPNEDDIAIFQDAAAAHWPAREQGSAPSSRPLLRTPLCRAVASMAFDPNDVWLNRIVNGENPEFDALINRLPNSYDIAMVERTILQVRLQRARRAAERLP
jgi:hypothetical protein